MIREYLSKGMMAATLSNCAALLWDHDVVQAIPVKMCNRSELRCGCYKGLRHIALTPNKEQAFFLFGLGQPLRAIYRGKGCLAPESQIIVDWFLKANE